MKRSLQSIPILIVVSLLTDGAGVVGQQIFEGATHIWREIFMDGRPLPPNAELVPWSLGTSG